MLNFGSNLRKNGKQIRFFSIFHIKIDFYKKTYFSKFEMGYILMYLNKFFKMKTSEFKIFISVESYEKTAEKLPKLLRCRKMHSFQII